MNCKSGTLEARWQKAIAQLKKLRYVPATIQAKAGIIHAKVFAAAFYGIEAASMTPAKTAKLAAAIIDVFRSRNNMHRADWFSSTFSSHQGDMDPVAQTFSRRVLQVRRAIVKKKENQAEFSDLIKTYAEQNKAGERWPTWYHHREEGSDERPDRYPLPQPHPTTKKIDNHWDDEIKAVGPIGLLIESLVWNGLVIDQHLFIWQLGEEPLDIKTFPYQHLKTQAHMMVARARTRAEWTTGKGSRPKTREIDREASQPSDKLSEEERGIVTTSMIGGGMAANDIASINEDVDKMCTYCGEELSTDDHIKWQCSFFKGARQAADSIIAKIPLKYLPACVRCGIAPAMKPDGRKSFWGSIMDDNEDEDIVKAMGIDYSLETPGDNADKTEANEQAMEILEGREARGKNARQIMLAMKGGHGTGINPSFPEKGDIDRAMQNHEEDYFIDMYGDGSHTSPHTWWASLGGSGLYVPSWHQAKIEGLTNEQDFSIPAIGQTGSSTRQELAGWILALTLPVRSHYATDSASMFGKALDLIQAARDIERREREGEKVSCENPFKRPWGTQKDGDLWQQAWVAVRARGAENQRLRKVKGHATTEDVKQGKSTIKDQEGNDRSDKNADAGVRKVGGAGLVRLGKWLADRHQKYMTFMARVQKVMAAVTIAEKQERTKRKASQKQTLGYDPDVWMHTDPRIRNDDEEGCVFQKLDLPTPLRGKHRFSHVAHMYKDIHKFLASRQWARAPLDTGTAGVTWLELFILYDATGSGATNPST